MRSLGVKDVDRKYCLCWLYPAAFLRPKLSAVDDQLAFLTLVIRVMVVKPSGFNASGIDDVSTRTSR